MELKKGNTVKIRSLRWYNSKKDKFGDIEGIKDDICGFIAPMSAYCGKTATVTKIDKDGACRLDVDKGQFWWDKTHFVKVVTKQ